MPDWTTTWHKVCIKRPVCRRSVCRRERRLHPALVVRRRPGGRFPAGFVTARRLTPPGPRLDRAAHDAAAIPIVGWEGRAQPSKSPVLPGCHHPVIGCVHKAPPRQKLAADEDGARTGAASGARFTSYVPAATWRAGAASLRTLSRPRGIRAAPRVTVPLRTGRRDSSNALATTSASCTASATQRRTIKPSAACQYKPSVPDRINSQWSRP